MTTPLLDGRPVVNLASEPFLQVTAHYLHEEVKDEIIIFCTEISAGEPLAGFEPPQ